MYYQIHFGANYENGSYGWSTDKEKIRRSVDAQLTALRTDYIDYGFIHCLDEEKDWQAYEEGGALAYLLELKEQGVISISDCLLIRLVLCRRCWMPVLWIS